MTPAGFARRYAAWSLDATAIAAIATTLAWPVLEPAWRTLSVTWTDLVTTVADALFDGLVAGDPLPVVATGLLHDPGLAGATLAFRWGLWNVAWPFVLAYALVALPWHAAGVASRWQASPGKRVFGAFVTGPGASRPTLARATARHLAAALSWLTLNVGHLMALGPAHAALHDRIAGTRVWRRAGVAEDSMRVAAWIAVQGVAVAALLWCLSRNVSGLAAGQP